MKHICLTVLLSTAITSVTNASDVGTGYFEGETGIVKVLAEFNSLHFKGFGEVLTPDVAFLSTSLTAVPIPAAVWFFGTGLLGLIGMSKKRYKL